MMLSWHWRAAAYRWLGGFSRSSWSPVRFEQGASFVHGRQISLLTLSQRREMAA